MILSDRDLLPSSGYYTAVTFYGKTVGEIIIIIIHEIVFLFLIHLSKIVTKHNSTIL